MTSSAVAKTSGRVPTRTDRPVRPDEERIGQRYEARRQWRARFMRWTFLAAVAAPTAIAALYFGVLAAPRYVSETQFIVRTSDGSQGGGGSALQGLLQLIGVSRSTDDANAVLSYLQSRDAVTSLEAALPLRQIYARDGADPLARFPRPFSRRQFRASLLVLQRSGDRMGRSGLRHHHASGAGLSSRRRPGDRASNCCRRPKAWSTR